MLSLGFVPPQEEATPENIARREFMAKLKTFGKVAAVAAVAAGGIYLAKKHRLASR